MRLESSVRATLGATDDPVRGRMVAAILHGPVSADALRAMGVDVGTQVGDVTTVRMPLSAAPAVARLAGRRGGAALAAVPSSTTTSRFPTRTRNTKRTQSPPLAGFNGNNVVVGLVDSGIQYQHDDFKNPDGTTRIYSIWDQLTVGIAPQPYNYGNECTQAQINAGTCGEVDAEGHGTHVAGSAAGDGSATGNAVPQFKYSGMANKATIIMVKTDFTDTGLIDAVKYIFAKAALLGRPAVVNMSLGTNLGPHDGTLDLELGLNALVGPGKVIVSSAGNEQYDSKQHGHLVSTVALDSLTFAVPTYAGSAWQRLLPDRRLVRGHGQLHRHADLADRDRVRPGDQGRTSTSARTTPTAASTSRTTSSTTNNGDVERVHRGLGPAGRADSARRRLARAGRRRSRSRARATCTSGRTRTCRPPTRTACSRRSSMPT